MLLLLLFNVDVVYVRYIRHCDYDGSVAPLTTSNLRREQLGIDAESYSSVYFSLSTVISPVRIL